jgi:chemotaxis protein CheX
MNVAFLNPFLDAAFDVLKAELNATCSRGSLSLERSASVGDDVNVMLSLVGQIQGVVLYGMSQKTALHMVSRMMNENLEEFDTLAQSGIGELGNVITGHAATNMAQAGFEVDISPPSLIIGKGTLLSTLDFDRLVVPIETELGSLTIHLALREKQGTKEN